MKYYKLSCYKASSVLYLLSFLIFGLFKSYAGEEFLATQRFPASSQIETPKAAKNIGFLNIDYQCPYPGNPINLKSLSITLSNGQEFETPSLREGSRWPFTEYGKPLNIARINLQDVVFPLTLHLRWLTNNARFSEMSKHSATHLTTLPLNAWTTWKELSHLLVINKEHIFTAKNTQDIFKVTILSSTHGAADTSLLFSS